MQDVALYRALEVSALMYDTHGDKSTGTSTQAVCDFLDMHMFERLVGILRASSVECFCYTARTAQGIERD